MDETSAHEVLLKHGKWIGATDFAKMIAEKRRISERQARTVIRKAYRSNQIKKHVFPDRTVIYGLTEFGPPAINESPARYTKAEMENVKKALEELRCELRFFREPTVKEVACRAGKHPEITKSILYALAPETGWKEPQENVEREAKEVINLAGWLSWKERYEQNPKLEALSNDAISKASATMLRNAEMIAKNYPDLVPAEITLTEIRWPEETKMQWYRIFGSEAPSPQYWVTGRGFVPIQELRDIPNYRKLLRSF
ncbi:MAG: hypothetical protein ABSG33_02295 [Candidatus Bathyarchaeia archaeon]|jgi:hypothetical protein